MKIPTIVREIQYQILTKKNIKNKPNKKKQEKITKKIQNQNISLAKKLKKCKKNHR